MKSNTEPNIIARTGRVQQWIDNPTARLPVSCTIFVVEDSMEGPDGIEASWRFVSHALRFGAGVAVHLSKLRPAGTKTNKGPDTLVASGPVSFAKIYSTLNETLRRGGIYKNGAVVAHLDIDHPDIIEFVQTPRSELPWIKRCVNLDEEKWRAATEETKSAILHGIKSGDIWLTKIAFDNDGNRIYGNVCLEVRLFSRGTCLLEHVNLGACNNAEPYEGYAGLAARELFLGIQEAANIARENKMERAFAIAPTASCSYRSRDIHGFTSTPEIAPPIARTVDRDSGEFGVETVEYGNVEIASEVGWDNYKLVADQIMIMLNRTGLLHGYSFNSWSDMVTYDEAFIEEWLDSPQTSLYYSLQVMGDTQDKTDAYAALDDTAVDDYLASIMSNKPDEISCDCQQ